MQDAAGDGIEIQLDDQNRAYHSVVSDLVSLLGHVQASLKLIELAVASETFPDHHDAASNIVALDDLTPCYAKASAALKACDANLGIALHFLLDSGTSMPASGSGVAAARDTAVIAG
jgi:hypothetical protein